ncbi:Hint domain-containing protein [Celeribacter sp. ULVN23_4]
MSQPLFGLQSGTYRQISPKDDSMPGPDALQQRAKTAWTARRAKAMQNLAPKPVQVQRRYNIQWQMPGGDICAAHHIAPALPVFETAFNGFARGALIPTACGPVAIEDLMPGDEVITVDHGVQTVEWIGSMTLDTRGRRYQDAPAERLYRITADTFGLGRPSIDLMLGAGAQYLVQIDTLESYLGSKQAMAPIAGMVDGVSVIEVTPISSVRSYHLALSRHSLIRVNGLEIASYHPGPSALSALHGDLRTRFMALFPHLVSMGDFGALTYPRLTMNDLTNLLAQ